MISQDYTKEISLISGQQKIVPWPKALLILVGLGIATWLVIYAINHTTRARQHEVSTPASSAPSNAPAAPAPKS